MNIWIGTSGFLDLRGMERHILSGKFLSRKCYVSMPSNLRRPRSIILFGGFQASKTIRTLVGWNAGTFHVQPESAAESHAFAKLRNCGDTLRYFLSGRSRLWARNSAQVLCSTAAIFQKGRDNSGGISRRFPSGMRAAFEFRHASWFDDEVFALFKARNAALCIADSEKLNTPSVASSGFWLPAFTTRRLPKFRHCSLGRDGA